MRRILVAAALGLATLGLAMLAPAKADVISVKLSDDTQKALMQLPAVFDQCVAGLTLHGEASACKSMSNFLIGMANEVNVEATAAAKAKADKAAADKAAAAAPAPATPAPAAPQGNPDKGAGPQIPAASAPSPAN
jgi:hypothetical protein